MVELRRAALQQAAGQWQRSVTTLAALQRLAPRHPLVHALLFEAHKALGDWEAVAELAPYLPEEMPTAMQAAMWRVRLGGANDDADAAERARQVWAAMPKRLRDEEALLLAYVDALASHDPAAAEAALRGGLKRVWRTAWVRRYGELETDAQSQLKTATGWLKQHPGDPALLLALGSLAAAAGDRQQAKEHLKASVEAEPNAAALAELGNLCVAEGDAAAANGYFQRAMMAAEEPPEAKP